MKRFLQHTFYIALPSAVGTKHFEQILANRTGKVVLMKMPNNLNTKGVFEIWAPPIQIADTFNGFSFPAPKIDLNERTYGQVFWILSFDEESDAALFRLSLKGLTKVNDEDEDCDDEFDISDDEDEDGVF